MCNNEDPFKATVRETQDRYRLRRGDVLRIEGAEHIVFYTNECRAACVPLQSNTVKYVTRFGREVEFKAGGNAINITPIYYGEILERRGEKGLIEWTQTNNASGDGGGKRKGRKGLLGHSTRDVVMAMGHFGWTFEEAKAALNAAGKQLADRTLMRRLKRGKKKEPAVSEEQLDTLRTTPKQAEEDPWAHVKKANEEWLLGVAKAEKPAPKKPQKIKRKVRRK